MAAKTHVLRKPDPKPVTAYPVVWSGRPAIAKDGSPYLEKEALVGVFRWAVDDPSDVVPAAKENPPRQPRFHPTRHRRLFYKREDAEAFRHEPGFALEDPVLWDQANGVELGPAPDPSEPAASGGLDHNVILMGGHDHNVTPTGGGGGEKAPATGKGKGAGKGKGGA